MTWDSLLHRLQRLHPRVHGEAQRLGVGFNDALAYLVMREVGVEEIFSFDRYFDEIPGVTRRTR